MCIVILRPCSTSRKLREVGRLKLIVTRFRVQIQTCTAELWGVIDGLVPRSSRQCW
ncbi:hypothetical protein BS78_08G160600 [Paspalum vaginatum]|nr:hypothetical protein BS78_08G160600 [Paspalum vaginatum]